MNQVKSIYKLPVLCALIILLCRSSYAQVKLEKEIKITDFGLHFDGSKVSNGTPNIGDNTPYDYYFGRNISAHGDAVQAYGDYVFMTWYRGGKSDRHMMLTRYNTVTNTLATIEFPHRHTGFQNQYWIGESHNTIAVGISPLDGTIHLLYDMHAYSASKPSNGSLANDYFRYSYSVKNAATLPDEEFTLDKFILDNGLSGDYTHLRLPGNIPQREFIALTYPSFFLNNQGDLLFKMREGGNNNGMYKFSKYDATTGTWNNFTDFNRLGARNQPGINFNWGLYGSIKYANGKIRIGFQRRSQNNNDKYQYQNGVYYAYSDDPSGATGWKNYKGEPFSVPLNDPDFIKVMEPGDYVQTTQKNKVHITGNFAWTVTENEDVHIISRVRDNQFNKTKYLHTYKPSGATEFITSEDFSGGSALYTSGGDVFLIGLSNGRVYIEKAEGGTNNFSRVYQATSGRRFDHGVVHIKDGKVYYYLMEDKSGNAQPLYLQIIDLDIDITPFRVSLSTPFSGQNFNIGETVNIAANAINTEGSISKVVFKLNGEVLGEDTTSPYALEWNPTAEGTFSIQAIAYDENNESVSSLDRSVSITVQDPNDITGVFYRLKNVETGKYLKASGGQSALQESEYVAGLEDFEFQFVKTTFDGKEYYSIDPKKRGVLRATGANFSTKYAVISSGAEPPNQDSDKVWKVHFNEQEGTYRFEARASNRFLYNADNGGFYNLIADENNNRSKWILETGVLGVDDSEINNQSISIYPNPALNNFTVSLNGFQKATIMINDVLGKVVFSQDISSNKSLIEIDNRFKTGVYLVRVVDGFNNVYHKKLIIN